MPQKLSRTIVIVQARMGASRLPGKVLRTLAGKTVLAHVLERCAAIANIDGVCCATTENSQDDAVAEEAKLAGVTIFRGSENDVLERYAGAAIEMNADVILRVTADCPLIDPDICACVLKARENTHTDYASNNSPPSFPHGLDCEVFSIDWLLRAAKEARKPSEREHVTPYIRNHPDAKQANFTCEKSNVAHHRWTLDTAADWDFFKSLFSLLPDGPENWSWCVPLDIVCSNPEISQLNAGQDRYEGLNKTLAEDEVAGFAKSGR
jgi:spore coat polysaccharide biosynthesis protein SpsF